jgi:hypothetical protein
MCRHAVAAAFSLAVDLAGIDQIVARNKAIVEEVV